MSPPLAVVLRSTSDVTPNGWNDTLTTWSRHAIQNAQPATTTTPSAHSHTRRAGRSSSSGRIAILPFSRLADRPADHLPAGSRSARRASELEHVLERDLPARVGPVVRLAARAALEHEVFTADAHPDRDQRRARALSTS